MNSTGPDSNDALRAKLREAYQKDMEASKNSEASGQTKHVSQEELERLNGPLGDTPSHRITAVKTTSLLERFFSWFK